VPSVSYVCYVTLRHCDTARLQVNVHVAVCDKPQIVHYADEGDRCCRGIAEFMSEAFRQLWHPEVAAKGLASLPAVQCMPLSSILSELGVRHVNFYVLDVEGAELMVLQSLDFDKVGGGVQEGQPEK
jgi:hypothetical protein